MTPVTEHRQLQLVTGLFFFFNREFLKLVLKEKEKGEKKSQSQPTSKQIKHRSHSFGPQHIKTSHTRTLQELLQYTQRKWNCIGGESFSAMKLQR